MVQRSKAITAADRVIKIKKLKEIAQIASYAIEETEKLQQKFIDIEVEYLNTINSKINTSRNIGGK